MAHVQRARGQPIVAENLSILPQTPPTVASAETSVLWVKSVQRANVQLVWGLPFVMERLLTHQIIVTTVANVVWSVQMRRLVILDIAHRHIVAASIPAS